MILGTMSLTASKAAVKLGSCVRIWVKPHGQGLSCDTPTRGPSQKANTSSGAGKVVYTNGCCKSTVAAIATRVWRENGDDHKQRGATTVLPVAYVQHGRSRSKLLGLDVSRQPFVHPAIQLAPANEYSLLSLSSSAISCFGRCGSSSPRRKAFVVLGY